MSRQTKQLTIVSFALALLLGVLVSTSQADASDDITAYFAWNCGTNLCIHTFNDITGGVEVSGGKIEYHTNMVSVETVTDDDNDTPLDLPTTAAAGDGMGYNWLTTTGYNEVKSLNTWEEYQTWLHQERSEDDFRSRVIDPTGARRSNNVINTNGDRNFRATIFDPARYEALQFGVNESDYHYFPGTWDPTFIDSVVDIYGTTAEAPAVYTTYLQEPSLKFRLADFSISEISTITPLDINLSAVTVARSDSDYTITFHSNYYQRVTFEITTEDGNKYYFLVNRMTGNVYDNYREVQQGHTSVLKLGYNLIYDAERSYQDYEVRAVIGHTNGTTTIANATPIATSYFDFDQGHDVTAIEQNAGRNLKSTTFAINASSDITSLDFTIMHKDALKLIDTYGGTFTGAGKGIHFDDAFLTDILNRAYNN